MPRDRYMEKKSRSSLMKFGLVGGIESDTDPGRVQVLDSNNVFPSPNGSEAGPRPGCEIRKRYRVTTDPPGRKAIVIETAPPDVGLGNLIMVINTLSGRNAIEAGAFVRDRTQLPLQSATTFASLQFNSAEVEAQDPTNNIDLYVYRTGDLSIQTEIFYTTRDGTATVAGLDYIAESGSFTFNPGEFFELVATVNILFNPSIVGKFFFFEIQPESVSTVIGENATTVVNIVAP